MRLFVFLIVLLLAACGDPVDDRVITPDDMGDVDMGSDDGINNVNNTNNSNNSNNSNNANNTNNANNSNNANNGLCSPNNDGTIERSEVPLRAGLNAKFKIALDADFDTAGVEENGETVWDLSGDFAGDMLELVELQDTMGAWWLSTFPNASYSTKLSATEDLRGVFQITDDALLLQGVVTPEDGLGRTELEYDPPVTVLQFPLTADSTWQTETDISGVALGVPSFYDEVYTYTAAGTGTLKTPFGDFQVQRVRVDLERTIGILTTTTRTYLFVTECFGTVASVVSEENEDEVEFTTASEIRRLAP